MGNQQFEIPTINGFAKDTTFSFSNAIGDFNRDGFVDIIVQNNPPFAFHLWENRTQNNNKWLKFKLQGIQSNRDGIGVRYECYAGGTYQSSYTFSGFSFLGQNSYWQHLGLGNKNQIDSLIITWPTGHIDKFFQISPNQSVVFTEGQSTNGIIEIDEDVTIVEGNFPTSVFAVKNDFKITVSPNPTKHQLAINTAIPFSNLSIYNAKGQLVKEQELATTKNKTVNIANLETGVYWLKVISKQKIAVIKWVKI